MFKSHMVNICLPQPNIGKAHFSIHKHGNILPQQGHLKSQQISKVCSVVISSQNLANSLAFTSPVYTGCPRRNVRNFGRVFLMLKYTDITQNTYI
jgi:hypothetical protein